MQFELKNDNFINKNWKIIFLMLEVQISLHKLKFLGKNIIFM